MEFTRQIVNGSILNSLIPLPSSLCSRKVEVIVLPAEDNLIDQAPSYKYNVGFAKGSEIPKSFFEPLSEEDLQAWGL